MPDAESRAAPTLAVRGASTFLCFVSSPSHPAFKTAGAASPQRSPALIGRKESAPGRSEAAPSVTAPSPAGTTEMTPKKHQKNPHYFVRKRERRALTRVHRPTGSDRTGREGWAEGEDLPRSVLFCIAPFPRSLPRPPARRRCLPGNENVGQHRAAAVGTARGSAGGGRLPGSAWQRVVGRFPSLLEVCIQQPLWGGGRGGVLSFMIAVIWDSVGFCNGKALEKLLSK